MTDMVRVRMVMEEEDPNSSMDNWGRALGGRVVILSSDDGSIVQKFPFLRRWAISRMTAVANAVEFCKRNKFSVEFIDEEVEQ